MPDDRCWIELPITREKSNVLDEMRWRDFTNGVNAARKQIADKIVDVACVCLECCGGEAAFNAQIREK
jgi:hypothetical protein